jgi:type I restriction enzyme S subunit
MKKKAPARVAKATSRQSTLNFPTSSEADLVAKSTAAETSTKSGAKSRRKRTADSADDADKTNESTCDSSAHPVVDNSSTDLDHELARLPKGWRWVTLREIADISGGITKGQKYRETDILRRVPYLRVANVQRGYLDLTEMKEIDATETKIAALQLQPGDILFNEGGDRDKLGRGWIWNNELAVCIHQNHVFRARLRNTEHSSRFVSYYSNSAGQQYFYDQGKHTTNLASINLTKLGELPIPLPPPAEQHRIVAEIEKQFTRLDAGVAALKRVQANLKRYRAAVLKAACEGKLVPTEAELARQEGRTFETGEQLLQRILTERRQNWKGCRSYKEPLHRDSEYSGTIPEGWAVCSLSQIAECLDSQRVPVNKTERLSRKGAIPYYGANGQVGYIDGYLFDETLVLVVEDETFVGRSLPFSYIIRGKAWVNNHAHVLRATSAVRPDYLNYALAYYPFTSRTTGSTGRRKLTQPSLMASPFVLPPIVEQSRITAELDRRLSVVEEIEAIAAANVTRGRLLRQSILQAAFEAKL